MYAWYVLLFGKMQYINRRAMRQLLRHNIIACSLIVLLQVHPATWTLFPAFLERILAIDYGEHVMAGKI
jgi:hypothetical protein